ncbi:unnamed protein product [Rotaria socialis]|uniref:Uncharacterized protein n=1 Tax=Rotaria socialis TaxID=392032 RepID=A0A820T0U7_9BILA|nr:unnamed protein product [Rotaria socialis]
MAQQVEDQCGEQTFSIVWDFNNQQCDVNINNEVTTIWLDTRNQSTSEYYQNIARIREVINHTKIFHDVNECASYLSSMNEGDRLCFLIVDGILDQLDSCLLYPLSDNVRICIFLPEPKLECKYAPWAKKFQHNGGYFTDIDVLLKSLRYDLSEYSKTSVGSTMKCLDAQKLRFNCFLLLLDLLHTSAADSSKQQLILHLKSVYSENACEIQKIEEFDKFYRPEDSVLWFNRDWWLYRVLNSALRTDNVQIISYFDFFLVDIRNQLDYIYKNYKEFDSRCTTYRGQLINTLLSSSRDGNVASAFSGDGYSDVSLCSVIIEIEFDTNQTAFKPAAYIGKYGVCIDEQTFLFYPGSLFWLNSVEEIKVNMWLVGVTVTTRENSPKLVEELDDFSNIILLQLLKILQLMSLQQCDSLNKQMLQQCRLYYANNKSELVKINDFEKNYQSDQAIAWYTKDSFLYRLVNTVLRAGNISDILDFRIYITDLYEQLTKVQPEHFLFIPEQTKTVYRGQLMNLKEFKDLKANINRFISATTFLSATTDRDSALFFSGYGTSLPAYKSVLFNIKLNDDQIRRSKYFASISHFSKITDEKEVLFIFGTIFQIKSIKQRTDCKVIDINLVMCDEQAESYIIRKINDYFNIITMPRYIQYFEKIIQQKQNKLLAQTPATNNTNDNMSKSSGENALNSSDSQILPNTCLAERQLLTDKDIKDGSKINTDNQTMGDVHLSDLETLKNNCTGDLFSLYFHGTKFTTCSDNVRPQRTAINNFGSIQYLDV